MHEVAGTAEAIVATKVPYYEEWCGPSQAGRRRACRGIPAIWGAAVYRYPARSASQGPLAECEDATTNQRTHHDHETASVAPADERRPLETWGHCDG